MKFMKMRDLKMTKALQSQECESKCQIDMKKEKKEKIFSAIVLFVPVFFIIKIFSSNSIYYERTFSIMLT